jgi:hypothetical protein
MPAIAAIVLAVTALVLPGAAIGQLAKFHWLSEASDPQLFRQVEAAFADELEPDRPGTTGNVVPMTVKYVEKIGEFRGTALVMLGYKETSADVYPIFRAFSYDPKSGEKTVIRGVEGKAEWLPLWEFKMVAHFQDRQLPDVVFEYFSCTECEAEKLLASFRYDGQSRSWSLRHWSKADGDDLMIGSDNQFGDDGIYSYDCLHTVQDLTNDGLDDAAVRCRETLDPGAGKTIRVTKDETFLYTFRQGAFIRTVLLSADPLNTAIQAALCQTVTKSPLCKRKAEGQAAR